MTRPPRDSPAPEPAPGGVEDTVCEMAELELLYLTQAGAVYTYVRSIAGLDRTEAEDITHTAFLNVGRRMRAGLEAENWVPYLFKAAGNAGIDWIRARDKTKLISELDQEIEDPAGEEPLARVIRRVDHQSTIDAVRKALSELPPRQCEVVVLHEMCNLPTTLIAQTLGIKEGTVRYHLSEGFRRLRALLLPGAEGSGTSEQ